MPLELTVGPAVVVRVPGKTPGEQITLDDLEPHLDRLAPGRIALFATGWYRHAGTPRFFEHPYLAADVGEALLAAGVRTFAIDTLNADFTGGDEFPIHDMFADAGGFIAENLAGTDGADARRRAVPASAAAQPRRLRRCPGARRRARAAAIDLRGHGLRAAWRDGSRPARRRQCYAMERVLRRFHMTPGG